MSAICWVQGRGSSRVLPYVQNQIFFFVRAAWYPDSESVQEPQAHRGTREGECVGTDQSEFARRGGVTYPPR